MARSSSTYESLVDSDVYFSENQRKPLLENAVSSVKPLHSVKGKSDKLFTHTDKLLDWDQHAKLLLSAVTNYDSQFVSASSRSTRKVCDTELGGGNFVIDSLSDVTEDFNFDIDTYTTTLLENVTNCGNSHSDRHLPSEDYSSLTPEERDLWKKISPNI